MMLLFSYKFTSPMGQGFIQKPNLLYQFDKTSRDTTTLVTTSSAYKIHVRFPTRVEILKFESYSPLPGLPCPALFETL